MRLQVRKHGPIERHDLIRCEPLEAQTDFILRALQVVTGSPFVASWVLRRGCGRVFEGGAASVRGSNFLTLKFICAVDGDDSAVGALALRILDWAAIRARAEVDLTPCSRWQVRQECRDLLANLGRVLLPARGRAGVSAVAQGSISIGILLVEAGWSVRRGAPASGPPDGLTRQREGPR